jgi:hypothetical protein
MSMPIVIFCLLGLLSTIYCAEKLLRIKSTQVWIVNLAVISMFLTCQAWLVSKLPVCSVSGFKQLVEFLEKIAPDEPVFYDGKNQAIFTFYVQAGDPDYRRRVVLGKKLLYAESLYSKPKEFVSSPQDVVNVLQKRSGCQWVVVDDRPDAPWVEATWHLRKAVKEPQFKLVKSLPIRRTTTTGVERTRVCVYRFLIPTEQVDEVEMPLFSLGENVIYRIKPIQR